MTQAQRDINRKLRVLRYAEEIGNVTKACRYFHGLLLLRTPKKTESVCHGFQPPLKTSRFSTAIYSS